MSTHKLSLCQQIIVVCTLAISACAAPPTATVVPPTPTELPPTATPLPPTPATSPLFKAQVIKFLEAGTKLTAMTNKGITQDELTRQFNEMSNIYRLMLDLNAGAIPVPIRNECYDALETWRKMADFWGRTIKYPERFPKWIKKTSEEYASIVEFMGEYAYILDTDQSMSIDYSIGKGLSGASQHFEKAKKGLILLVQ